MIVAATKSMINPISIQEALKDLLGGTIKEMMEAEMDEHLGYSRSERSDRDDYRNGYKPKKVKQQLWQHGNPGTSGS